MTKVQVASQLPAEDPDFICLSFHKFFSLKFSIIFLYFRRATVFFLISVKFEKEEKKEKWILRYGKILNLNDRIPVIITRIYVMG